MKKSKLIGLGLLVGAGLGIYSCINNRIQYLDKEYQLHNQEIIGTVLEETRTPSAYAVKVKIEGNREIALSIIDGTPQIYGNIKKESLDLLIESGTQISFPRGNMWRKNFNVVQSQLCNNNYNTRENFVSEDTMVVTRVADRIKVLGEEAK